MKKKCLIALYLIIPVLFTASEAFARGKGVLPLLPIFFALFTSLGGIVAIVAAGLISDGPLSALIGMSGGVWSAHKWFGLWPNDKADFSIGDLFIYTLFAGLGFFVWTMITSTTSDDSGEQGGHTDSGERDIQDGGQPQPRPIDSGGEVFPAPLSGRPSAMLVGIDGPVIGRRFPVEKRICRIGAMPENEVVVDNDPYISGDHAWLCYTEDSFLLVDRRSRNGTRLNGKLVADEGERLRPGDQFQVGSSTFEVLRQST